MLLEHKNAIIYGGGAIGGAVARAFAGAGANVYLAGRTLEKLDAVAGAIRAAGGEVQTAQVDALDQTAVDRRADTVVAQAGTINISFHVIAHPSVHGTPLAEMSVKDFMQPIEIAVRTTFLTTRAAARHMIQQKSGSCSCSADLATRSVTTTLAARKSHSRHPKPCDGNWPLNLASMESAP